jgi:hypothetical protein
MICIYNYADDNTVSNCDNDIDVVTTTLENDSMELINWFSLNFMKANPDKFQEKNRKVYTNINIQIIYSEKYIT